MGRLDRDYRILGLRPGADLSKVKSAFRRLARIYHPDIAKSDNLAHEKFLKINEAYRSIINNDIKAGSGLFSKFQKILSPKDILQREHHLTISTILLNRLSLSYMEAGRYPEAQGILTRLISEDLPLINTYINIAYLFFLKGELDRSLSYLVRAKNIYGTDYTISINLSLIYKKLGRFREAVGTLEEIIDDAPDKSIVYLKAAKECSFFDKKGRMIETLRRALDEKKEDIIDGPEGTLFVGFDKISNVS